MDYIFLLHIPSKTLECMLNIMAAMLLRVWYLLSFLMEYWVLCWGVVNFLVDMLRLSTHLLKYPTLIFKCCKMWFTLAFASRLGKSCFRWGFSGITYERSACSVKSLHCDWMELTHFHILSELWKLFFPWYLPSPWPCGTSPCVCSCVFARRPRFLFRFTHFSLECCLAIF